eukprot:c24644_g1_i1.p1 GENE.c24644_g1_i1~~c24644_g1_i1.p1  ORF type:complete len:337 (-),score=122.99 c24644_g1_i1:69-1079(-)
MVDEQSKLNALKTTKSPLPFILESSLTDAKAVCTDPIQMNIAELGTRSKFSYLKRSTKEIVCVISPNGRWLIFGRRWDNSISVVQVSTGRVVQILRGHHGIVESLSISSPKGQTLISGGRDCKIAVWGFLIDGISKGSVGLYSDRVENDLFDPEKRYPLSLIPFRYLHGHLSPVISLAADMDYDCVVSGGLDGTVLLHSLSKGDFVRRLKLPTPTEVGSIYDIKITSYGDIIIAKTNNYIYLFEFNGKFIASTKISSKISSIGTSVSSTELYVGSESLISVFDISKALSFIGEKKVGNSFIRAISAVSLSTKSREIMFCASDTGSLFVLASDGDQH